jgi:hypothetical protein
MNFRQASCCCGRLRVTAYGEPVRISMCHCLECQKRTGSVFGAQAWFESADVQVSGEASEFERIADSGNRIVYRFCPGCGSTVFYEAEIWPNRTAIPVGAFADPSFPAPRVSVYEDRKHAWVEVPPDIEHLD